MIDSTTKMQCVLLKNVSGWVGGRLNNEEQEIQSRIII